MTFSKPTLSSLPLLENGDRLTRVEFERRYNAMPHCKKAELIEGRVYMGSPVRAEKHCKPHGLIIGWLFDYCQVTPGIEMLDNATVILDEDNEPQPDACLWLDEAVGGRSRNTEDDYIESAAEVIVEIAASTASYDLHDKMQVYRRSGVQEYLVWRAIDRAIDWFILQEGMYVKLPVDDDGTIRSRVFPGLWLALEDLLAENLVNLVAKLNLGLASVEYRAWRQLLESKLASSGTSK
jgi:Uma2 family endonuclease